MRAGVKIALPRRPVIVERTEQQEDDEQEDSATSLMGISMALPTSRPLAQPFRVPKQHDQQEQDRSRGISI